jgi:outer membrane protein TolC
MPKLRWGWLLLAHWSLCAIAQTAPIPTITLEEALRRARANSVQFQAAVTESKIAHEDRVQARAAMLPSLSYSNQYLYTEGNGTPTGRFIANNGVHEYISQGNPHEAFNLGLGQIAELRRSGATEALTRAKAEIAARGLVATVVADYYGLVVAQHKHVNAQTAAQEATDFLDLSRKLEQGGEVAHSDVVKAQLQSNDRDRDLQEAQLGWEKAKLALAVLLFRNFNQDFNVADDLDATPALPLFADTETLAQRHNPALAAALAAAQAARQEVAVARSAHFPTLTLDYWYGIDAIHFATRTDGVRNLGYSAAATLNIPVWNWGATQSKVKQAEFRRQQARVELSAAQRGLIADLHSSYAEAESALAQLERLRSSVDLAVESLRLTKLRYQGGEATALEVVDAQNTLVQARNAYADGEARYRVALAGLQTLTGTL